MIGQFGDEQLGAKGAAHVVQMLQTTRSSVRVDVNNAGVVPHPAKASTKAIARPCLTEAIHENGGNTVGALSLTQFFEKHVQFENSWHCRSPALASTLLGRAFDDGVRRHFVPGQRNKIGFPKSG